MEKLYVLVRQDIDPGYQIAQSIHAKDRFNYEYPELARRWYDNSQTIVVLGVPNEVELLALHARLRGANLACEVFWEPDISEHTALAVEPGEKTSRLLKGYTLAGRR